MILLKKSKLFLLTLPAILVLHFQGQIKYQYPFQDPNLEIEKESIISSH